MLKTRNSFDISLLTKVNQIFRENDFNRTEHSSGFYLREMRLDTFKKVITCFYKCQFHSGYSVQMQYIYLLRRNHKMINNLL